MIAVFAVADGADGQHHADVRTVTSEQFDGFLQIVSTRIYCQFFLLKQCGRALLTVVHNLASLFQTIYMVRAQRQENGVNREP